MYIVHTEFLSRPRIAYFSMEIALCPGCNTYAGGLGVLAGDVVRSVADLDLPIVAVTLVSRQGYFHQSLTADGVQSEAPEPWDPAQFAIRLDARVAIELEKRAVWIGGWLYVHQSPLGGRIPVLLLDTDLPDNASEDRHITDELYGGDLRYRLAQQAVLGIGGVRLLRALGFRVAAYHLNEGHSAFLTLQLLRDYALPSAGQSPGETPYDVARARELCIFTTHTPVDAAQARYGYELWEAMLGDFIDGKTLRRLAGPTELNMTQLAATMSAWINGVAERHAETARGVAAGRPMRAVTNGVHATTWTAAPFAALYDRALGHWRIEPELLGRVPSLVSADALWDAHVAAKATLCSYVEQRTGVHLQAGLPILGFARRMTSYKRPDLLFADIERLRTIARRYPFQLVYAGKAHPADNDGKHLIVELYRALAALRPDVHSAFLPNYELYDAAVLVAGADIWLNTPLPPLEASGTSGMKAAMNGVPSLSVLDGWWVEGCVEGVTGWGVAGDGANRGGAAAELYDKLERAVLPTWYGPRAAWIAMMQGAIALNGAVFNSHRMMRRYASEAYLR